MGMYNDGNVYGVYCFIIDDDESYNLTVLIDKKCDTKMNLAQIEEIKAEYEKISEDDKQEMGVRFYTRVSTTYEKASSNGDNLNSFMTTWPGTREMLEELFLRGDIRI